MKIAAAAHPAATMRFAVDIHGGSPEEFGAYLTQEREKRREVAKAANVQPN